MSSMNNCILNNQNVDLNRSSQLDDYNVDISHISNSPQKFLSCTRKKEIQLYNNDGKEQSNFERQQRVLQQVLNQDIPGPQQYDVDQNVYRKKDMISFPKCRSVSLLDYQNGTPGPGQYEVIQKVKNIDNKQKIVHRFRKQQRIIDFQRLLMQREDNQIKNSDDGDKICSHLVNVDKVNSSKTSHQNVSFARCPRYPDSSQILVGPGYYDSMLKNEMNKFTMSKKIYRSDLIEQQMKAPGPGSYNVSLPKITEKEKQKYRPTIGKSQRSKFQINSNPGPGQYDLKSVFNKKYEFKVLNRLVANEKTNPFRKVVINEKQQ